MQVLLAGFPVLLLLFGFFLFATGIYLLSQLLFARLLAQPGAQGSPAARFILGLLLFCGFCNAILLIPALLEAALGLDGRTALAIHHACLAILALAVIAIALAGSLGIAASSPRLTALLPEQQASRWRRFSPAGDAGSSALFFFALAVGTYLFNALRSDFVYDTGLYHFPFVNHVKTFGLEIGLANLHTRFAYYNIQQFGQVALQLFSPHPGFAAPSLNLLFLSALLIAAADAIRQAQAKAHQSIGLLAVISFWLLAFAFGTPTSGSLLSFDADYSLSVAAAIVIYHCFAASFSGSLSKDILLLLLSLPLLKLAGVVPILLVILFALLLGLLKLCRHGGRAFAQMLRASLSACTAPPLKAGFLLSACLYLLMLSTNLTLSGYLIYPQPQTGPIGAHAVPRHYVQWEKDITITSWARSNTDLDPNNRQALLPTRVWLPTFLRTGRGKTLTLWIASGALVSAASLAALLARLGHNSARQKGLESLFALSAATTMAALAILVAFPPDPRFYSWMRSLTFFLWVDLLLLLPVAAALLLSSLAALISAFSIGKLSTLPQPKVSRKESTSTSLFPYWRSRARGQTGSLQISIPTPTDQCWATKPPCSAHSPRF
jgi:hypothetical protein